MDKLRIESLSSKLTELDVARNLLTGAEERLARARIPYSYAIQVLEEAMEADGTVLQCQQDVEELQALYTDALHLAQNTAVCAWEGGFTSGKKEWEQDEWEIRLRTTPTPSVSDVESFIDDIHTLRAHSVVKGMTLNKAKAVELHQTAGGGVRGLSVEEKTSCSLRKVEK